MYRKLSARGLRALFLVGVSGVSLTAAGAADLSGGGLKDGPAYVPYNWTGFYAGTHSGAALGAAHVADPYGPSVFGGNIRTPGTFAGGQIGYNYQFGQTVAGVEADASWASMEGTNTCFAVNGASTAANCRVHVNWFGTVTGRLGQALGPDERTLVYAKGGAAWETSRADATANTTGYNSPTLAATSSNQTRWGWTAGAGIEHALTPRWSAKLEYDYLDFGSANIVSPLTSVPVAVSQDMHSLMVGVNYKFGGALDFGGGSGSLKDQAQVYAAGWSVEAGTRYMYSWGRFQKDLGFGTADGVPASMLISRLTYDNLQTNSGELFGRVDTPWNVFVKGVIGAGSTFSGKMNDEDYMIGVIPPSGPDLGNYSNTLASKDNGGIQYGIADLGYNWLQGPGYKMGFFVGGGFFNQQMNAYGCLPISAGNCIPNVPTTGHANITENDQWAGVRVGSAHEYMLTPRLKLSGEAAYLPYVSFTGVDHHYEGNSSVLYKRFPESGNGQGAQFEAMLSYGITDNISLGAGGRYWAMWTTSGKTSCDGGTQCQTAGSQQYFRAAAEQAGLLAQLSYKFGMAPEPLPLK